MKYENKHPKSPRKSLRRVEENKERLVVVLKVNICTYNAVLCLHYIQVDQMVANLVGLKGLGLNYQGHLVKIFQRLMLDDGRLDKQRSAEDYPSLLELSLVTCYPTNYQISHGISVIPRSQPLNCQLVSCKQGNCWFSVTV